MSAPVQVICVVGARPNFMKMAPILEALKAYPRLRPTLVHTGQHYDREMSEAFFRELDLPRADLDLNVGSGTHGRQTGKILEEFERILLERPPELVVVAGDVNSTLACALASVKLHVPVAHVEAGLRSRNRLMAEEINRVLTDRISDYLFTTSRSAGDNLRSEGIEEGRIHFVGNVMIDTLRRLEPLARERSRVLEELSLAPGSYAVLTLHRPELVDSRETFLPVLGALEKVAAALKLVCPLHPRTRRRLEEFGLLERLEKAPGMVLLGPRGYLDFLRLTSAARLVLTDSGGIQEETTVLGVPCLTLRPETERPVTVAEGTNTVVGLDPGRIVSESLRVLEGKGKAGRVPELWDGRAAERIAAVLARALRA